MLRALPAGATAEAIQDVVYEVGKRHPFPELKAWFACLYQVLLGQTEGPRFGGFVALYGVAETVALIEDEARPPPRTRRDAAQAEEARPAACRRCSAWCCWSAPSTWCWKEFRHLKLADIAGRARARSRAGRWSIVVCLDRALLRHADLLRPARHDLCRPRVSYRRVAFASFCAYALSHNLGFAAVSGAAVRYRLYAHWGLTPFQIAKVVAFCSLTFGLGGMVLGGMILFLEPDAVPFFGKIVPLWGMYAVGAAACGSWWPAMSASRASSAPSACSAREIEPAGLAHGDRAGRAGDGRRRRHRRDRLPAAAGRAWARPSCASSASTSPPTRPGSPPTCPGGLGVFDTAMLLGLEPYLEAPQILGAIVVFRLYYYIIPLFLAGTLFAGNEILLRGGAMVRSPALTRRTQSLVRLQRARLSPSSPRPAPSRCAARCCSRSACWTSGPISPGSTRISPKSPPMRGSSSRR